MKPHNLIIKLLGTICPYYWVRMGRQTGCFLWSNAGNRPDV